MSGTQVATRIAGRGSCVIVMALLSACGGSQTSGGSGSTIVNLLAFNSASAPPLTASSTPSEVLQCPTIEVLDGTASSRVYAGADQSNSAVKYQFSIGDVARECSHVGDQLVMKIGVAGRALIGPAGTPGTFSAPVRIAIRRDKDEKAVETKLYQIPVAIPAGDGQAPFSLVADAVSVPFTRANADDDYTILVGFDTKGDGGAVAKKRGTAHRRRG